MATKRLTELIAEADERADERPAWSEGECDRPACNREGVPALATTAHREFDQLCLPCADFMAEDGDLSVLVRGGR